MNPEIPGEFDSLDVASDDAEPDTAETAFALAVIVWWALVLYRVFV